MKIKVIKEFIDRENDMTHRKIGETFEADEPRAKQFEQLGFVEKAEKNREKYGDYPFLSDNGIFADSIGVLIGTGKGRGMGLMLILSGFCIIPAAFAIGRSQSIRSLE